MTAAAPDATITIGTRRSQLAQWQTRRVIELIESNNPGLRCRIVDFTTIGDKTIDRPIPEIGGKGVFTRELEEALSEGTIDLAVHSLKDLPTAGPAGLTLGAICEREDVRDVLVAGEPTTWESLPSGARIGTSSTRRAAQLLATGKDIEIVSIRGNVDTRVRKAGEDQYDAVILAAAGVHRLGLQAAISEYLSLDIMLPAPGQGALAVQCRAGDETVLAALRPLDDQSCRAAVTAERCFLEELGGGCAAPIGAHAVVELDSDTLQIRGMVAALDGSRLIQTTLSASATDAAGLGKRAAAAVLADGARELLT